MEFSSEREVKEYVKQMLLPYFFCVEEVNMVHFSGERMRIDFVCAPLTSESAWPAVRAFGVEVKNESKDCGFKNICSSMKQCIDYQQGAIDDQRLPELRGCKLDYVLLFHAWLWNRAIFRSDVLFSPRVEGEAGRILEWIAGAERLAGKFKVGWIRQKTNRWRPPSFEFLVCATPIWSSVHGQRLGPLAESFSQRQKIGNHKPAK